MEGIVHPVTEHPLVVMAVCFIVLLILYFLFKSLIKLALIIIIAAVAIGGYCYFQHPESRPASFKDAVQKARTEAGKVVDRGEETYRKGKEWLHRGNELYRKGREWFDKRKDVIEKEKDAAGHIVRRLEAGPEVGDPKKR